MNRIAVLGLGWWGAKLARNFAGHPSVGPGGVIGVDPSEERRAEAAKTLGIETVADAGAVFARADVAAVVIATPPPTHFGMAMAAFTAGKHVLVTKPPTTTVGELEGLVQTAAANHLVFMLDSTFVYNQAVRKVRELLDAGAVQDIRLVQLRRWGNDLRLHHVRRLKDTMLANGVDVIQDLVFHDLAMLRFLFPELVMRPVAVHRANTLARYTPPQFTQAMCDTALICLETERFPIHISLSWVLPERRRELLVAGPEVQLVYDDLRTEGKISLFRIEEKQETVVEHAAGEPLTAVVDHFVECLAMKAQPLTDGQYMLDVMGLYDQIRST
jgi:predicted dehydrogenase